MGKTPERRTFATTTLRYRRKVPVDNQQEPPPELPKIEPPKQQTPQQQRTPQSYQHPKQPQRRPARRFRPKPHPKQSPSLLRQLLWKAKPVQPAPTNQPHDSDEEEAAFAAQQRQTRKLLASEAVAATKSESPVADAFVAESSSQETQSGSEDEAVFLPYTAPQADWRVYPQADDTDGEEASPVLPSESVQEPDQQEVEKTEARRKQKLRQKQKNKKQKQKRAAAKEQQRQQQKVQRSQSTEEDATASVDDESSSVDIFHPHSNLASEMDEGVCEAVVSQLKEVVPFIVVGDVACPVVASSDGAQPPTKAESSPNQSEPRAGTEEAIVDFRQHVIAMLDHSKESQMQHRDSFVAEHSGFDAAASYDFLKRRFTVVQRSAGVVYY